MNKMNKVSKNFKDKLISLIKRTKSYYDKLIFWKEMKMETWQKHSMTWWKMNLMTWRLRI